MPLTENDLAIQRRLRFSWHHERHVAGSARPGRYGELEPELAWLAASGIRVIINLCLTPLELPSGECRFELIHEPVFDGHPPAPEQMRRIIDQVRTRTAAGLPVLVHCRGGVGRTATVLAPVLMEVAGLRLDEALARLREAGRLTQSMEQWRFLQMWPTSHGGD